MNEINFTELAEQANRNGNFVAGGENNSIISQSTMEFSGSNAHVRQLPRPTPVSTPVVHDYNYKLSVSSTNTHFGLMACEGNDENNDIKELWSPEELTANLVNKTATRIANLKHKLDEQLKGIKLLQAENEQKYRDYSKGLDEKKVEESFHTRPNDLGLLNKTEDKQTVKNMVKQANCNKGTKTKRLRVAKNDISSTMKRRKRLRRGLPVKEFFYHPLVVECSAFEPNELTKEEFLRQLRLIPTV